MVVDADEPVALEREQGRMSEVLSAPFPYIGGKSAIASIVWDALGQPKHYLEPMAGSLAVLLARPDYRPGEHVETVCDADGFVANAWRAMQFRPDETARWCDWPVNHADLCARRKALLASRERLLANLIGDDTWCDPLMAGYWIWSASCWIGSGLSCPNARPDVSHGGNGVHKLGKRPNISGARGCPGVHKTSTISRCVALEKPCQAPYNPNIYAWFRQLSQRLRYVRVVCGDWTRICGGDWQDKLGVAGIFLDPPYSSAFRNPNLYDVESLTVAQDVGKWALERGDRKSYRIVVAGYAGEHPALEAAGWRVHEWSATGGYSNQGDGDGKANRHRERLWLSPHCLNLESSDVAPGSLFAGKAGEICL